MVDFKALRSYPSALWGLVMILVLLIVAIYTVISLPYQEAIELWRGDGDVWAEYPRYARPQWVNYLRKTRLPTTKVVSTFDQNHQRIEEDINGLRLVKSTLSFDFTADEPPSELILFLSSTAATERPFLLSTWICPDGRRLELEAQTLAPTQRLYFSQDKTLLRQLSGVAPEQGLFVDQHGAVLKGTYQLELEGYLFDQTASFDAKLVVYGRVHGWAGTDHRRRDLRIPLLWGIPVALSFGLLAAMGATIATFVLAAVAVWYGGWVDVLIQRLSELNLILPMMPLLIMIGTLYSRSIWVMLTVIVTLSLFGGGIKTYRAVFLSLKTAPYIEAAKAYGASNKRLIFRYMMPPVIPILIPAVVNLVPRYVFLEASLALLGLGDPALPTWGKLLDDALAQGAMFNGHYYWILQPIVLLMTTGLAFAMVGFALDRIFNPKLRGR